MTGPEDGPQAPAPAARPSVRVWDPLVRLVHRGATGAVLLNAAIVEDDSTAHEVIGYIAVGLVATPLVWGHVGTPHARFSAFPRNPVDALRHIAGLIRARRKVHLSHNPAGALMVDNLWATLLALGAKGYTMGTPGDFGMDWVEAMHEGLFASLMVSVGLHLAGIVIDSLATRVNLVRALVDGHKHRPPEGETE